MHTEKQAGQMPMTFQLSKIKTGPPAVRRRKCPMAEGQRAGRRGAAGMVNQGPLRGALPCSPPAPERPAGHVPQSTRMVTTTHHPGSGKEELQVDARPGRSPRLGATGSAGRHAQPLRQKTHPTEQDAPAVVHGDLFRDKACDRATEATLHCIPFCASGPTTKATVYVEISTQRKHGNVTSRVPPNTCSG